MKEVYLDNSATTKVFPEVADIMTTIMCEDYGNPSSMHQKGVEAEKYIKEATKTIAKILKVNESEILYTSCGTESDNMAIIGAARANQRRGKHLITTRVEHPAVLNAMKTLEEEGFEVSYIGTDDKGVISLEDIRSSIRKDTILVSTMHINNEIGSVMPVAKIGAMIKEVNPAIIYHVDAVQSFGKLKLFPGKMNIDLLSVSAHKIHGPKGMGFLYINDKIKINPIIFGGGQQAGRRSGTENVPGIAALGLACRMIYTDFDAEQKKLYALKKRFINRALKIEGVSINGIPKNSDADISLMKEEELIDSFGAPHVISVSVRDVRAEVLLHSLEDKGVYVSAGSACSTHKRTPSATLTAIGLEKSLLESTVRFSFSVFTDEKEVDYALEQMESIIPMLRRYTRR